MSDEHQDPVPDPTSGSRPPIAGMEEERHDYAPPSPVYGSAYPSEPPPVAPSGPTPYSAPPRHHSGAGLAIVVASIIAFVIASFAGFAGGYIAARTTADGPASSRSGSSRVTVLPSKTLDPAVAAAAASLPSVVYVDVTGTGSKEGQGGLPELHPDVPSSSSGSGVAFKKDGEGGTYILTNEHVIAGASRITVRDASGESVTAKLIGADAETDIAVIRVPTSITAIEVGESSGLQVGQMVVAIGSPYGLEHSVTMGVISAIGRSLPDFQNSDDSYPLVDVIQTDAAINPGNSGGALVDRAGRLIGINTAIYSNTGANDGIGFAVPVGTAVRVAEQLISGDTVKHPFLGIIGQTVTAEFAREEELDVREGAYVVSVVDGTGAKKAGLKKGDVITKLENATIRSMDDLLLQVRRRKVGDTVKLTIVRDGDTEEVEMTIGDKPENVEIPSEEQTETD